MSQSYHDYMKTFTGTPQDPYTGAPHTPSPSGSANRQAKRDAGTTWWQRGIDWLSDATGIGEGMGLQGIGVSDDTGRYTGPLGTGEAGSGGIFGPNAGADSSYEASLVDLSNYDLAWFEQQYAAAQAAAQARFGSDGGNTAEYYVNQANALDSGQSFEDWAAEQGIELNDLTEDQAGMQDLIDQLANPDKEEGYVHAARMLGYSDNAEGTADEQIAADIQGLYAMMEGGAEGQQGMSDSDRALRERQNQTNMRETESRYKRLVENSFNDSGSTVQMFAAADEASRQLSSVQMQQDDALNREQLERQMAQINQKTQMWGQLVQTRQMSYTQFMEQKTGMLNAAIGGYLGKINTMLAENEQYLSQHQGDMAILEANANRFLNMAEVQRGIDQSILDATTQIYEQAIKPQMDALLQLLSLYEAGQPNYEAIMTLITQIGGIVAAAV